MKKNVLVFPCGSEIGLEIYRALSKTKEVILYGASSVSDHGEFVYEKCIAGIPFATEDRFISEINRIVDEYSIDYIIPANDLVLITLAEALYYGKLRCKLLTSPYDTCKTCCSKKLTYQKFQHRLPVPVLYETLNDVDVWPVFLKPDFGFGSKGTTKVDQLSDAEYYLKHGNNLLILEYLPGREYTIDCFTDRHGHLRFAGGRERVRISNGISVRTSPIVNPKFQEIAEIINQNLSFCGMWFFQVKENKNGMLTLMEIAPRVAGAMGLYRNLGINFALLSLYDAEGFDVNIIKNNYLITFDRALESRFKIELQYDHVYLDYDDCIVVKGILNLQMVTFLYQCVSNGIGITLLTRHAGDLNKSLNKYRLDNIFDSIIKIEDDKLKSVFIKEKKSIFIDDSFAERFDVQKNTGIPVFAPDAIESLFK